MYMFVYINIINNYYIYIFFVLEEIWLLLCLCIIKMIL